MEDRSAHKEDEIKITPEMIEAGASLLCGFQTETVDEEYWAEEVYRAMAALAKDGASRVPPEEFRD